MTLVVLLIASYLPQSVAAQSQYGMNGTDSWVNSTIRDLPQESVELNDRQLKRLNVEWRVPKRQDVPEKWSGPTLEIEAQLFILQDDGKTRIPVDWPLPVSVIVAKLPDTKPDWSRRHDNVDSVWADILVGRNVVFSSPPTPFTKYQPGTIKASIPLSKLRTQPGENRTFQVGISFGQRRDKTVTWRNTSPVLSQSIAQLSIQGPKPLGKVVHLINAVPSPMGWDYNPIDVIRSVNGLRLHDKKTVISGMREFLMIAYDTGYFRDEIVADSIDTSNQYSLSTLVPVLFPKVQFADGIRKIIRVQDGIPFHTIKYGFTSGWPGSTRPLVDQAESDGELIQDDLKPTNDPLLAADKVYEAVATEEDKKWDYPIRQHIRLQAWRMVKHLVKDQDKYGPDVNYDRTWNHLKSEVAQLKIRWDTGKQLYIAADK